MTINDTWKLIKQYHGKLGIKRIPTTSVVSPIFPGQFNFCLDERHVLEKYGNFIDIEEESFQKMMPVIRLADFDGNISENKKWLSPYHLSCFTMTTIGGGHVVQADKGDEHYHKLVTGIVDFLCNHVGLDKERLYVSYFDGTANLKDIEGSRKKLKNNNYLARVHSEYVPAAQNKAVQYFTESGILSDNIQPSNTRDCFLTTNWDVTHVPMGYRNEIFYRLNNGYMLDIATIENLIFEPVVEFKNEQKHVVDIKPWRMNFVISGLGIERLIVAKKDLDSIYALKEFKPMVSLGLLESEIEAIRILHRVLTDAKWEEITSSSRRAKLNHLLKFIDSVSLDNIFLTLKYNADGYSKVFPELKGSIAYLMEIVCSHRLKNKIH